MLIGCPPFSARNRTCAFARPVPVFLLALSLSYGPLAVRSAAMLDVSVAQYGARGGDYGDDTAAFQKAFDEVIAAGGGRILVPAGDFVISKRLSVEVPNAKVKSKEIRLALAGAGIDDSRLVGTGTDGLLHFQTAGGGTDVTVRDLSLLAAKPKAGVALSVVSALGGVRVERATLVERVRIAGVYGGSHFTKGILMRGQWRPLIRDVTIEGAASESMADDSPAFAMEKGIQMDAFYAGQFVNCSVRYAHTAYSWVAEENGEGFVIIGSVADFCRVGAVNSTPEQEPGGCLVNSRIRARDVGLRIDHKRLTAVTGNEFRPLSPDGTYPYADVELSNSWAIQVNRNRFPGPTGNRVHVKIDGGHTPKDYSIFVFSRFTQINDNAFSLPPDKAVTCAGGAIFGVMLDRNTQISED
jgi:hypothetical protein